MAVNGNGRAKLDSANGRIAAIVISGENRPMGTASRREFFQQCAVLGATALVAQSGEPTRLLVESNSDSSFLQRLAERELFRGLALLNTGAQIALVDAGSPIQKGDVRLRLRLNTERFTNPEAYSISAKADGVEFLARSEKRAVARRIPFPGASRRLFRTRWGELSSRGHTLVGGARSRGRVGGATPVRCSRAPALA